MKPLSLGIAFASLTDGYPFFRPMLEGLRRGTARHVAVRLFEMPATDLATGTLDHAPDLNGLDGLVMMSPVNLQLLAVCQRGDCRACCCTQTSPTVSAGASSSTMPPASCRRLGDFIKPGGVASRWYCQW